MMVKQREAYRELMPQLRDKAEKVFGVDKDLNFKETAKEFLSKYLNIISDGFHRNQGRHSLKHKTKFSHIGHSVLLCDLKSESVKLSDSLKVYVRNSKAVRECVASLPRPSDLADHIEDLSLETKCAFRASVIKICLDMHEAF